MNVFYQDEFVRLIHGDCRGFLDKSVEFDHVITDPPNDAQTHTGAQSDLRPEYGVHFLHLDDPKALCEALKPKRWALAFCSVEMLGDYRRGAGERWVRAGIWDRLDGAPQFTGDRPAQAVEGIAIWHSDERRLRWNGGGKRGIWRHGIARGVERVHETQKPVGLMRELILDFTDLNDLLFDPFAGSCSTGVAAKECGRHAVLIEIDEERCRLGALRLAEAFLDERLARVPGQRGKQGALDWSMG